MYWLLAAVLACSDAPRPDPTPVPAPAPVVEAAPEPVVAPSEPAPVAPTEPRYAASHVLVAWAGALGADEVTRTREEARALAEALRDRARAGEPFEALARAHSDDPSAARGGRLGVYRTGTMLPAFERAVAAVPPGAIGPIAETPYGFHVVRREPVVEVRAAHVLVSWAGAWRSSATRSEADARARIEEARAALEAGTPFHEVARRWSDDATATDGGDLGTIAPGQLLPDLEAAAFALEPGEISEIVETPYGFHLIRRAE